MRLTLLPASISIHALREEGDARAWVYFITTASISIHALREEGDAHSLFNAGARSQFLSTPSARRATTQRTYSILSCEISIHALREEGDFYPPPRPDPGSRISIHALREEGDFCQQTETAGRLYFYPRPPRGGRQQT